MFGWRSAVLSPWCTQPPRSFNHAWPHLFLALALLILLLHVAMCKGTTAVGTSCLRKYHICGSLASATAFKTMFPSAIDVVGSYVVWQIVAFRIRQRSRNTHSFEVIVKKHKLNKSQGTGLWHVQGNHWVETKAQVTVELKFASPQHLAKFAQIRTSQIKPAVR